MDEVSRRRFYYIDPALDGYYREAHEALSDRALERFVSASRDVEEASKCLALGRYTASVFHLMRITEKGMDALAETLGIFGEYQTWDPKIRKMVKVLVDELRKGYDNMSPAIKGRLDFFKQATERLTAVQHALRNETMHSRSHYGREDAIDIYRATLRFIETLAEKLEEPKGVE